MGLISIQISSNKNYLRLEVQFFKIFLPVEILFISLIYLSNPVKLAFSTYLIFQLLNFTAESRIDCNDFIKDLNNRTQSTGQTVQSRGQTVACNSTYSEIIQCTIITVSRSVHMYDANGPPMFFFLRNIQPIIFSTEIQENTHHIFSVQI